MKSPELEKILEEHSLWWLTYGKEGTRLDLTRANLLGANFRFANLTEADLFGANLIRANLFGVDLTRADLTGARLPEGTDGQISNHGGEQSSGNPTGGMPALQGD